MFLLDPVHRRATKIIRRWEHLCYGIRLREFKAFFHCLKWAHRKDGLFIMECRDRMRGNDFNLKEGKFRLDISNKIFTEWVVNYANRFPRDAVDVCSLGMFKARLNELV